MKQARKGTSNRLGVIDPACEGRIEIGNGLRYDFNYFRYLFKTGFSDNWTTASFKFKKILKENRVFEIWKIFIKKQNQNPTKTHNVSSPQIHFIQHSKP